MKLAEAWLLCSDQPQKIASLKQRSNPLVQHGNALVKHGDEPNEAVKKAQADLI